MLFGLESGDVEEFQWQREWDIADATGGEGEDLFVHQSSIRAEEFQSLGEGETVEAS